MSALEVRPVRTAGERRRFLAFPWRLYRGDALWVPPLWSERRKMLDPRRGRWFAHGDLELFVAWRGCTPVGTICSAEDREMNRGEGLREAIFGFFECVDDLAAARLLVDAARSWARSRGLEVLRGPFNLDYEDGYGILVEGWDRPPAILCGHNPAYYQSLLERLGFQPARPDNLAFAIPVAEDSAEWRRVERLAERLRRRGWVTIRVPDLKRWRDEVDTVQNLLNESLKHLADFRPWHREAVESLCEQFVRVADPDLVLFAEADGRTVGWFPGIPNFNEVLIKANGLRRPWDWVRLAAALRRRPACLAVKTALILPEYWQSGVAILLIDELRRRAMAKGYTWADLSLTSDDNPSTPGLAIRLGARLYKRYRVYRIGT